MLSIRWKVAATTVSVLAATMGGAATAQMSPSPAQEPAQEKAKVGISILPGIIGPGNGVQGSGNAKWAVIGKYDSSKEGKKVVLQRRSGTSSSWVTDDKGKIDKKGRVVFAVPKPPSGSPVSYRVDGPGSASTPVSTESARASCSRWLTARARACRRCRRIREPRAPARPRAGGRCARAVAGRGPHRPRRAALPLPPPVSRHAQTGTRG